MYADAAQNTSHIAKLRDNHTFSTQCKEKPNCTTANFKEGNWNLTHFPDFSACAFNKWNRM